MKSFIYTLLLSTGLVSMSAQADLAEVCPDRRDAVCVGRVILNELNEGSFGEKWNTVMYYNEDNCSGQLLAITKNTTVPVCEQKAPGVSKKVWGLTIGGKCHDIPDMDFLTACKTYAVGE